MATWEVTIGSKASEKAIKAARLAAESEAFAHGISKEDVKVVFVLETE